MVTSYCCLLSLSRPTGCLLFHLRTVCDFNFLSLPLNWSRQYAPMSASKFKEAPRESQRFLTSLVGFSVWLWAPSLNPYCMNRLRNIVGLIHWVLQYKQTDSKKPNYNWIIRLHLKLIYRSAFHEHKGEEYMTLSGTLFILVLHF